jgi:hypothetical protein
MTRAAALGVLAAVLAVGGCGSQLNKRGHLEADFMPVYGATSVRIAWALRIDGPSWARLLNRPGETREQINDEVNEDLKTLIAHGLRTFAACPTSPWRYTRVTEMDDGSVMFELKCGDSGTERSLGQDVII